MYAMWAWSSPSAKLCHNLPRRLEAPILLCLSLRGRSQLPTIHGGAEFIVEAIQLVVHRVQLGHVIVHFRPNVVLLHPNDIQLRPNDVQLRPNDVHLRLNVIHLGLEAGESGDGSS